jgi:hypothetical protein
MRPKTRWHTRADRSAPLGVLTAYSDFTLHSDPVELPSVLTMYLQPLLLEVEHCAIPAVVETYTSEPWPGTATTSFVR